MRLAYVTVYDAASVHGWSGIGLAMANAFERAGVELVKIGSLRPRPTLPSLAQHAVARLRGKNDHLHRDPANLRHYAAQVEKRLASVGRIDAIVAPGTLPISYLETDAPIVVWTDCTFGVMVDYYRKFTNLSARTLRDGHEAERLAMARAALLLFTSRWAAESAVLDYSCEPSKVMVAPMGANFGTLPGEGEVSSLIAARQGGPCRLLLIGVDWERKGADIAVEATARLVERGVPAELTIVGCHPPRATRLPPFVRCEGFVSKATPEGEARLKELYADASFFFLPTRAECAGIVFGEASAFGLPSITSRTGGAGETVRDGVNGVTLPVSAPPVAYADEIERLWRNPAAYEALARSSLAESRTRLNWANSVKLVLDRIGGILGRSPEIARSARPANVPANPAPAHPILR